MAIKINFPMNKPSQKLQPSSTDYKLKYYCVIIPQGVQNCSCDIPTNLIPWHRHFLRRSFSFSVSSLCIWNHYYQLENHLEHTHPIPTSLRTHCIHITNTSRLKLFGRKNHCVQWKSCDSHKYTILEKSRDL